MLLSYSFYISFCIFFFAFTGQGIAGTYLSSGHGGTNVGGNGLSRTATTSYAPGNCAHCHEQHTSIGGVEPAPDSGNDLGPDIYLGMGYEEGLCLHCHKSPGGGDDADGSGTADNINSVLNTSFGHYPADYSTQHQANELQSNITNNPHVECTDCHNPHMAAVTNHAIGTNAIATTSPLYGATGTGTTATDFTGTWLTGSVTYSALDTATMEYQICFKCHSGVVGDPNTWRGGSGTTTWTDVAKEFNPANNSYHPVVQSLSVGTSSALATSQLYLGWSTNVGTQTMYCSDCHGDNTTPEGPHGSADNIMLRSTTTYDLWPFNPSGAPWDLKDLFSKTNNWDTRMLCRKCHPIMTDINSPGTTLNNAHSLHTARTDPSSRDENYPCITCHIAVPHGGSLARLMGQYSEASPYTITLGGTFTIGRDDGGNSNEETNPKLPWLTVFTKNTRNAYVEGDCTVHTNFDQENCGGHHNP